MGSLFCPPGIPSHCCNFRSSWNTEHNSMLIHRMSSRSVAFSVSSTRLTHWYLFISSTDQAGSLGSAGVLAETSHCPIFSPLLMRRCSLITRCWILELLSFVSEDLAKCSWIFLVPDMNCQLFHFQVCKGHWAGDQERLKLAENLSEGRLRKVMPWTSSEVHLHPRSLQTLWCNPLIVRCLIYSEKQPECGRNRCSR